ncbi:MAG: type II secretion system F family protein [Chloroflexi bacterium]|nr:MAG: type II secretion system F family protein [Chloroflexota bacterium]
MLLIVIAIVIFGAVSSLVFSFVSRPATATMESRITDFRQRTAMEEREEIDLDVPFVERVLKPGIEGIAHAFSSVLPASVLGNIQKQLIMAGNPMTLNAFVTFWAICIGICMLFALVLFAALPASYLLQKMAFGMLLLIFAWMLPRTWLKGQVKARQKNVIRALPDAMDLVTTCVEAGLGLDAALARVAEKTEGPFAVELSRMLRDVAMGKLRRDAMTELDERIGVDELSTFITSVIQAEQLGVGIAQVLRVQSDQLRTKRRQRAERSAHEAPIKMLFPLVLFIFPAFLIVILGPAVIRIASNF